MINGQCAKNERPWNTQPWMGSLHQNLPHRAEKSTPRSTWTDQKSERWQETVSSRFKRTYAYMHRDKRSMHTQCLSMFKPEPQHCEGSQALIQTKKLSAIGTHLERKTYVFCNHWIYWPHIRVGLMDSSQHKFCRPFVSRLLFLRVFCLTVLFFIYCGFYGVNFCFLVFCFYCLFFKESIKLSR